MKPPSLPLSYSNCYSVIFFSSMYYTFFWSAKLKTLHSSKENIKSPILCFSQHRWNYFSRNMQNKHYYFISITATLGIIKKMWKLKSETNMIFKLRIPVKSHITRTFCDYLMYASVISMTFLLVWYIAKPHQVKHCQNTPLLNSN